MTPGEVSLKEYFDTRLSEMKDHLRDVRGEHEKRLQSIKEHNDNAVKLAADLLNKRMDYYNEEIKKMQSILDRREGFWGVIAAIIISIGALAVAYYKK